MQGGSGWWCECFFQRLNWRYSLPDGYEEQHEDAQYLDDLTEKDAVEYIRCIKKTLRGEKDAGYDDRLVDYALMERFGWTQQQIDETPEDTVQAILLRWRVEAENTPRE